MRWGVAVIIGLFVAPAVVQAQPYEPAQPAPQADGDRYRRRYRPRIKPRKPKPPSPAKNIWLDVELTYRFGVGGPAGRVPTYVDTGNPDDESPGVWERAGKTLSLESRALLAPLPLFLTGRYEAYSSTRIGASPRALTFGVGFGKMFMESYKGGRGTVRTWDRSFRYDRMGRPCKRNSPDYYRKCFYRKKGGEWGYAPFAYGPGVAKGWAAGWLGWRQLNDFIVGETNDQANPLGSPGGPVVGVQAMVHANFWLFTARHEFFYYTNGTTDDQGSFGWAARVAGGLKWLLFELQWRLDHGSGGEFTIGIGANLPLLL